MTVRSIRRLRAVRRFGATAALAFSLGLVVPASAYAQLEDLTGGEPVVPIPTPKISVPAILDPVDEVTPVPSAEETVGNIVDDVTGEDPDDGDTGGGSGGGTPGNTTTGTGSSGSGSGSTRGTSGTGGTSSVTNEVVDEAPPVGIVLGPPKSYTAVAGEAAVATAERAARLAGAMAPPLLLAAFALVILVALARGNDKLVRLEEPTPKRTYKL